MKIKKNQINKLKNLKTKPNMKAGLQKNKKNESNKLKNIVTNNEKPKKGKKFDSNNTKSEPIEKISDTNGLTPDLENIETTKNTKNVSIKEKGNKPKKGNKVDNVDDNKPEMIGNEEKQEDESMLENKNGIEQQKKGKKQKKSNKGNVQNAPLSEVKNKKRKSTETLEPINGKNEENLKIKKPKKGKKEDKTTVDNTENSDKLKTEETSDGQTIDDKNDESKTEGSTEEAESEKEDDKTAAEEKPAFTLNFNENTIFVGNVPLDCTKKALTTVFKKYGPIEAIRFRGIPVADTRVSKKVAFIKKEFHPSRTSQNAYIRYKNEEDSDKALAENGQVFEGHHLRVDLCYGTQKIDDKCALFVGNLDFSVEDEDLWKLFESCGEIDSVRVPRDKSGMSLGTAFVNFKKSDSVELALEMGDITFKNRVLRVQASKGKSKRKDKAKAPWAPMAKHKESLKKEFKQPSHFNKNNKNPGKAKGKRGPTNRSRRGPPNRNNKGPQQNRKE